MNDALGKPISAFVAIILIFLVPVALFMIKHDSVIQTHVQQATEDFVNVAAQQGKITTDNYMEYVNRLDATNLLYDVKITIRHKTMSPNVSDDGKFEAGYAEYYKDITEKRILDTLYPDDATAGHDFMISNGDFIVVQAYSVSPTLGSQMASLIAWENRDSKIVGKHSAYVYREESPMY